MFYATHNVYADLETGNRGFLNSWEVSRYPNRAERDNFVARYENKNARAVSRREAATIWRDQYLSDGKTPPAGGLFATDCYGDSRFWDAG